MTLHLSSVESAFVLSGGHKMRLYIADDNADFAEFCSEVAILEGWSVTICQNGVELLAKVREERGPALLLVDIQMPVMDGIEVIQSLNKIDRDLRIRFITGGPSASAHAAQLIAGARALNVGEVLSKPLSLQDLRGVLKTEIEDQNGIFAKAS
ncbi:response regulator [Shimia sp. R9_1]|uniref:response regulator n=1 Tax=Shimia sp. R9_1 TaxID=2821111 RepID=UPI001ADA1AF9|nr:response regulator [Shimia sp. R9_1]MBO9406330.1 response regulator [Shimia sp. R9_1]